MNLGEATREALKDQPHFRGSLDVTYRPFSKAANQNQCWMAKGKCERCRAVCLDRDREAGCPV